MATFCNLGCRRIKSVFQSKNPSEHACVPTLKISRPKKRTFSDVSDLMKDLNVVPQNSPIAPELPVLPGKRAVSTDDSAPLTKEHFEPVAEPEVLEKIKDRSAQNTKTISSAIQQELFHKDDTSEAPVESTPGPAIQLDLLLTSRRDNHENSLAEETLIPCTKPSNKFVDTELEDSL